MSYLNQKGIVHLFLLIIVVLVVVIGGYLLFFKGEGLLDKLPGQEPETLNLTPQMQASVEITNTSFYPQVIKVKKGTQVTWKNSDKASHQIASDPHPTHENLEGLESLPLLPGSSYSYIFEDTGIYTYHDHLNPFKFKGTVVVE